MPDTTVPSVLFINPGHEPPGRATHEVKAVHRDSPPYFALKLGAHLQTHGIRVEVIDTHLEADYRQVITERLRKTEYTLIGITVFIGLFQRNAHELTTLCRQAAPDIPVVWGGPVPSSMPDDVLDVYRPDYLVRFEGEDTLLELVRCLFENRPVGHIHGLSFRKNGKNHHGLPRLLARDGLNNYAVPDWSLLGAHVNRQQIPYVIYLRTSQGCPHKCTFCYHQSSDHSKSAPWRPRSAAHVLEEVDFLHDNYGIDVFSIGDDNFLSRKRRALEIFEGFRQRGLYIEELVGHMVHFTDEMIEAMEGLVCKACFNCESASPGLLKLMDKHIDLARVPGRMKKLYDHGITSATAFIIGIPGETDKDLRNVVELMFRLRQVHPYLGGVTSFFMPIPGTPLFDYTEKYYGRRLPRDVKTYEDYEELPFSDDAYEKIRLFHPGMSKERFYLLTSFQIVFRELFRYNQLTGTGERLLKENPVIRELFDGYETIRRDSGNYTPYVLDQVLDGKQIDLKGNLHRYG